MMYNDNKNLAYSIQKDIVSIYYKDVSSTPVTKGKTAKELINLVDQETLPDVGEIKYINTTVSKVNSKYKTISSLKYKSNDQPESTCITIDDTITEYDLPTSTLTFLDLEYTPEDNGTIILNIID